MKLFTKYNRINLLSTVVIFLLGCVAFSFLLRYVVIRQIDEDLKIEKHEILTYVGSFHALPPVVEAHDQYTSYKIVTPSQLPHTPHFYTAKVHDKNENEDELIRAITFALQVNEKNYLVTVSKSLEGTDDLIQSIIVITVSIIVLILAASFIINRLVLRKLWNPFYNSLQTIQGFKLGNNSALQFSNSNIEEFSMLNTTLSKAVNKAQQDYLVLKEFTENASHELQTPLAVIRSKLDLLIQHEDLSQSQSATIQGAYDAVQQMSKLNQSLLLLAKIENRQFSEKGNINVQQLITDKQTQFRELWQSRDIQVSSNLSNCTISGNLQLADILLNNLLSNATKHNIQNGSIIIQLQPSQLQITNTGAAQPLDEQRIFSRFYKGSQTGEQHGLGLSIIRQICEVSGYTCTYRFMQPNQHTFTIHW